MTDTVFTSRDFNREPGRIKRAGTVGSVIITERGQPALAVLPYADTSACAPADWHRRGAFDARPVRHRIRYRAAAAPSRAATFD